MSMSKKTMSKRTTKETAKPSFDVTKRTANEIKPAKKSMVSSKSEPGSTKLPAVGDTIKERYLILVKLGEGGYGAVYEILDRKTKEHFAMKVELIPADGKGEETLKLEIGILKRLQGKTHIVKYHDDGMIGKYRFLIMQLAGRNLASLRRHCPNQSFTNATTVRIGAQMLEAIEDLHVAGFVHRDIKPANFSMGRYPNNRRIVYILDYGLARRYLLRDGTHRPEREKPGFRGTIRYAPLAAHKGKDMGRRDDLWSWLYMLVEFRTGKLPWKKYYGDKDKVGEVKENLVAEEFLADMEPEFIDIFNSLTTLQFESEPPYAMYQNQLKKIMERKSYEIEAPFDWDEGGSHYKHTKYVKAQPYAKQMQKKKKVQHENPTDPTHTQIDDDEEEEDYDNTAPSSS